MHILHPVHFSLFTEYNGDGGATAIHGALNTIAEIPSNSAANLTSFIAFCKSNGFIVTTCFTPIAFNTSLISIFSVTFPIIVLPVPGWG